jgi:hypothetical protein
MIRRGLRLRDREVGAIKIGGLSDQVKKAGGTGRDWRPPVKFDHFVIITKERDSAGRFKVDQEAMAALGEDGKPRRVGIYLLDDDPRINFGSWYAFYDSKHPRCLGDGVTAVRILKDGTRQQVACSPEIDAPDRCPYLAQKLCKPHGKLQCLLQCKPMVGAVYAYRTCGWNSVSAIYTSQARILTLTGVLAALPLDLVVGPMTSPVEMKRDGKLQRVQQTYYVVHIEYKDEIAKLWELASGRRKLQAEHWQRMAEYAEVLPAGLIEAAGMESDQEAAEIAQEFYGGGVPEEDVDKEFERKPATVVDMAPADGDGRQPQPAAVERAEPEHSAALDERSLIPPDEPSSAGKSVIEEARERSRGRGGWRGASRASAGEETQAAAEPEPAAEEPGNPKAVDALAPPGQTDLF